jgi:mono/diheme cytochrome c family protein
MYTMVGIIGLAVLWIGGITLSSGLALASKVSLPAAAFDARGGDAARGKHLVEAVMACSRCHGADLGGAPLVRGAVGRIDAPNLTPGGPLRTFSDADFERAIRHGVAPGGTRLYYMPSFSYAVLSDADLRDTIAYLRSLPPVERASAPRAIGFGGRMMAVTHELPAAADEIDQNAGHAAAQAAGPTPGYGKYLARIGGCVQCHGADFAGGRYAVPPDGPAAPNLTPAALASWTPAQFAAALRTGRAPGGRVLDSAMPWRNFSAMNDDEVAALYAFLKTVPPVKSDG